MARVKIVKKDGTPTPYFWQDSETSDPTRRTVYKETPSGVKKMRGVYFNVPENKLSKD